MLFEEDAPNIIVNIMNDDKWLAIVIVVIVFMILCFVGCMYLIYHRYNPNSIYFVTIVPVFQICVINFVYLIIEQISDVHINANYTFSIVQQ